MKNNEVDKTIKYIINHILGFIAFIFVMGSIMSMINNDIEIEFSCDSGFIGVDVINGDFENMNLSVIDNMKCDIKLKGNAFALTGLID